MRTFVSALVLLAGMTMSSRLDAQSPHAAPPSALDQAIAQHASDLDSDRAVLERLLANPAVRAIAGEAGLDVVRAQSAVATLDAEQLGRLAAQAREAEQGLAGGQSRITISTTLLIIALLVIILLIVALK